MPLTSGQQGDLGSQEARTINAAATILKELAQAALGVHPASQAGVGAAQERPVIFDRAEHGAGGMLPWLGAFAEPAIVGHIHKEVCVLLCAVASQLWEHVLETDQGRCFHFQIA